MRSDGLGDMGEGFPVDCSSVVERSRERELTGLKILVISPTLYGLYTSIFVFLLLEDMDDIES